MIRRLAPWLAPAAVFTALVAPAPAWAQTKIEYGYPEGKTLRNVTQTKLEQTLSIAGQNIETQSQETTTTSEVIGKRDAQGNLPISVSIDALKANIQLPMNITLTFDSANPDAKQENLLPPLEVMIDVMKALSGSKYELTVDKANEVTAVSGTEASIKRAEELNPQAAEALKGRLNADAIKKRSKEAHAKFPAGLLVRQGETWTRTEAMDLGSGQTMTFEKKYEYQGTVEKDGKTLDKIGVTVTGVTFAQQAAPNAPAKITKSDLDVESSKGTILFDRALGQPVDSSETVQILGALTMEVGGMELEAKLDLKLESSTVSKAD